MGIESRCENYLTSGTMISPYYVHSQGEGDGYSGQLDIEKAQQTKEMLQLFSRTFSVKLQYCTNDRKTKNSL
jgi:hypothetical protein